MSAIDRQEPWRPSARVILGLAVLAETAFLLMVPRYLTVDGAAHVGGAALIRDILQGAGGLHLRYVEVTPYPAPNLVAGLALTVALLVADPASAERLLQVAYVAAIPLGLLYAVRGIHPGRDWLALLAIPLTFTFAFQYGFYDFSFGVALCLVAAGFAWRHRLAPGSRTAIVFGLLALLVYVSHLVPFLELGLFVVVTGASRVVGSWRAGGARAGARATLAMVPLLVAALPSIALAAIFLVTTSSAAPVDFLNPVLQAIGDPGTRNRSRDGPSVGDRRGGRTCADARRAAPRRGLAAGRRATPLATRGRRSVRLRWLGLARRPRGTGERPERWAATSPSASRCSRCTASSCGSRRKTSRVAGAQVAAALFLAVAGALFVLRLPTTLSLSAAAEEVESLVPCVAFRSTMIQANLALPPAGPLGRTDPGGCSRWAGSPRRRAGTT